MTFEELPWRLKERIVPEPMSGCWLWQGGRDGQGYGVTSKKYYGHYKIHRYTYTMFRQEIPEGLVLDHLCRVRSCCNPNHLEVVTCRENILRGVGATARNARKIVCSRGHSLADTYPVPTGGRRCRICTKMTNTAYKARQCAK